MQTARLVLIYNNFTRQATYHQNIATIESKAAINARIGIEVRVKLEIGVGLETRV